MVVPVVLLKVERKLCWKRFMRLLTFFYLLNYTLEKEIKGSNFYPAISEIVLTVLNQIISTFKFIHFASFVRLKFDLDQDRA